MGSKGVIKKPIVDIFSKFDIMDGMIEQKEVSGSAVPWTFRNYGLVVEVNNMCLEQTYDMGGGQIIIPPYTNYACVDFEPCGKDHYDPTMRTFALYRALVGMRDFFHTFDPHFTDYPDEKPVYMVGVTNYRMARFVRSLGFKLSNGFPDIDEVDVIGEISEIREKFEAKMGKVNERRFVARTNREKRPISPFYKNEPVLSLNPTGVIYPRNQ